jgi:SAM-dependent methyltransferase
MRALIGRPDAEGWDLAPDERAFPTIQRRKQYEMVLDFGCGCGRTARQLATAPGPKPKRYIGLDLHAGMISWANEHLAPQLPGFEFIHQDIYNAGFNPNPKLPTHAAFPVEDETVTLLIGSSVFTHLVQPDAEYYLNEVRRVLRPDGIMVASFFLFEKQYFPMMQDAQDALYINANDLSNAVILDRDWLLRQLRARGLAITAAKRPEIRGFQWELEIVRGDASIDIGRDDAPFGRQPPPVPSKPAHLIG